MLDLAYCISNLPGSQEPEGTPGDLGDIRELIREVAPTLAVLRPPEPHSLPCGSGLPGNPSNLPTNQYTLMLRPGIGHIETDREPRARRNARRTRER